MTRRWDAIVIGAGPNGLSAAVALARAGRSVCVIEQADVVGGGTRTEELTLPGFLHDVCSTSHPMAVASPFFRSLGLESRGVRWIHSPHAVAHPFPDGSAAWVDSSVESTAEGLREDGDAYRALMGPLVRQGREILEEIFHPPFHLPRHPLALAQFGVRAVLSAEKLARSKFRTERARALFAGIAAHSASSLRAKGSAAVGLVLNLAAHLGGWPIVEGGSRQIASALESYFRELGGEIVLGQRVSSMRDLPEAAAYVFDLTPKQFLQIAGDHLPPSYRRQLERYRYGPGTFKLDWALSAPVPWRSHECSRSAVIHLGASLGEIIGSEEAMLGGEIPSHPYVLLCQPSLFDPSRAPSGKHTLWAYCHVAHGSSVDMTELIERQIERVAPGFRERILARSKKGPAELERSNPNLVGGDISGGMNSLRQILFRPAFRINPYETPNPTIFICSSSTPPGPGVHGMSGFWAAQAVLNSKGPASRP